MKIEKDKILHFIVGLVIGAAGSLLHWSAGIILSFGAGIGKEVWDKQTGKGTPEWQDAAFTAAGGVVGAGLVCAILNF